MKRLIIIVEGQTEKEFVEKSLRKHFENHNIFDVRAIMIQTSKGHKGGFVNYDHLKNDLNKILKSEKDVVVSMFVDYFRLPKSFPNYDLSLKVDLVDSKIEILQEGIFNDIDDLRFIPYIQKHEFEALLFSSETGFTNWFENDVVIDKLNEIVRQYENPEDINTGSETSPSKRIINIMASKSQKYDKIAEGNLIAEEVGLDKILEKCPRLKDWVNSLILKLRAN